MHLYSRLHLRCNTVENQRTKSLKSCIALGPVIALERDMDPLSQKIYDNLVWIIEDSRPMGVTRWPELPCLTEATTALRVSLFYERHNVITLDRP